MTCIKLFAGLGNQLFQYSYGLYLQEKGEHVKYIIQENSSSIYKVFNIENTQLIYSKHRILLQGTKLFFKLIGANYCTGFYQERKYCDTGINILRESFKKLDQYIKSLEYQIIANTNSVAIHIRGGDYLEKDTLKEYGSICTKEYYLRAINAIKKPQFKTMKFFIFTNDIPYAKSLLDNHIPNHAIINNPTFSNDPGFDLFLMSKCKFHIISNSTFAWWGASLASSLGKIGPSRWTNTYNGSELFDESWIRI